MEPSELLRRFTEAADRLAVPYFITGSIATIYYGEPRFTNDIDIVAAVPLDRVGELIAVFPPDEFYVSEDAAREAVMRAGSIGGAQFNIIHPASGLKIDVMIAADTPFNRSRFSRCRRLPVDPSFDAVFASPEDVILKKLEYFAEGGSEKHIRDIAGVLKLSGSSLDFTYIELWCGQLGLAELWRDVLARMSR